jgi:hypothetical protein
MQDLDSRCGASCWQQKQTAYKVVQHVYMLWIEEHDGFVLLLKITQLAEYDRAQIR